MTQDQPQAAPAAPAALRGMRMDHAGISVADLDEASRWYQRALGLSAERTFHAHSAGLRGVMLVHESGYRIELLHRPDSAGGIRAGGPDEAVLTRGYGHVAFTVADVATAFRALVDAGASARVPPCPAPREGALMAWVADPDGNLIELLSERD